MGVGHDFQAERMGGRGDRLHFFIGKLCFQSATLLGKHAAGRGDLDDIGTGPAGLAYFFRALDGAGAGIAAGQQRVDVFGEARHVAMAADDRQGWPGGDDAWSGNDPIGGAAAEREGAILRGSGFAYRGETRFGRDQCVFGTDNDAPFRRFGGFSPEIATRITGQMNVQVDQAGHHGLVGEVDDFCRSVGSRIRADPDFGNLAFADEDRGRTGWLSGCIGQQTAYANDLLLRERAARNCDRYKSGNSQTKRTSHDISLQRYKALLRSAFASCNKKGNCPDGDFCLQRTEADKIRSIDRFLREK